MTVLWVLNGLALVILGVGLLRLHRRVTLAHEAISQSNKLILELAQMFAKYLISQHPDSAARVKDEMRKEAGL